ncbi:MAG: SRPBCC family protein [Actinobacteria bacterium]|nr:SRPBCC family protein [Actinomycetota bacterium]
MRMESSFEVPASPEVAWDLLMDVPRVIPCMPGAELTDVVDDETWKARISVKLGPIGLVFATDVKREEADVAARRATLSARARELRGRGGGQATIQSTLVPVDGGTRVELVTDLTLSGAVAQYGRGMVEDVSSQLVGKFADCLKSELSSDPGEEASPRPVEAAKPISGLSLALGALRRAVVRFVRRR